MPTWLEAVLLGIVQGLTEFIPVSSSGHLVLVPYIAGWDKRSLAFDVMLHVGTLGAALIYFRIELWAIARGVLGLDRSERGRVHRRLGWLIVAANVPVAIVGLTLAEQVEDAFASPPFASGMLLVTAVLLLTAERLRDRRMARSPAVQPTVETARATAPQASEPWDGNWRGQSEDLAVTSTATALTTDAGFPLGEDENDPGGQDLTHVSIRQAMIIGVLQSLAVLPGVSRSGATIAAGVSAGLTREAATRFSFLLVIPVLVGAAILNVGELRDAGGDPALDIVLGALAAGISGYAAIRYLVALVGRARLSGFALYCLAASAVGFIAWATLGPVSTV